MAPEGGRPTDPSAVPDVDPGLVRNRAGTGGDRSPAEPVEELELEQAIARNARALRLGQGFSVGDMAERIGISKAMLSKIENAQTSCSLSTLARLAAGLDVPVTSLFRGADLEREAIYTEAGKGAVIVGRGTRVGHHYELLGGLRGQHKRLEPVLVTLADDSEVFPRFQHPGTEMLYMLEGVIDYRHGDQLYLLEPGDSLLFDADAPHGPEVLVELLDQHRDELALVFGRTKHGMEKLSKQLAAAGFAASAIHGNKSQGQRERAIKDFREGKIRVLVATDVAARGIDIPGVRHVYNYELPNVAENYVHRIGRTARAGADGRAVALCAPDEMGELKDIEKAMKAAIPVASGTRWDPVAPEKKGGRRGGNGGGGRRFGGGAPKPEGASKPGGANRRRRPARKAA